LLSSDGTVLPLSQAREEIKIRALAFARPDADSKSFDGGVYNHHRFCEATDRCSTESMLVVLAEPIAIEAEWRFSSSMVRSQVAPSTVVGASYRPAAPYHVDLAAESAQRWGPAAICGLDLAAAGDRIGIVEANCFKRFTALWRSYRPGVQGGELPRRVNQ
jgi:hypothetical protein